MQEFIEKLIGRLEEEQKKQQYLFNNVLNNDNQRMVHAYAEQCYLYMTDIANQLAEEHNDGWIVGRTPDKDVSMRVWITCKTEAGSFVRRAWWLYNHFAWDNKQTVHCEVVAWQRYNAPAPYQPNSK